jgi:hypothetical protein
MNDFSWVADRTSGRHSVYSKRRLFILAVLKRDGRIRMTDWLAHLALPRQWLPLRDPFACWNNPVRC